MKKKEKKYYLPTINCCESVQSMFGSDCAHLCPCFCLFCYALPIITPQATYCFKPMGDFQHCKLDCLKCQTQGGLVLARSLVNHVLCCLCVQDRFWSSGFQLQSRCGRRIVAPVPARLSLQMVPIPAQKARQWSVPVAPTQVGTLSKSVAPLNMLGWDTKMKTIES